MKCIQQIALCMAVAVAIPILAQQGAVPKSPTFPSSALHPAIASVLPSEAAASLCPSTDHPLTSTELRSELSASELRLQQAILDSKAGWLEKLWPAILGLFGVMVGGGINIWLQSKQRVAAEKANRASAAFDAQTRIIEYRSRQAYEFYYPLWLSLQRTAGVRRQLCDQLHAKDPALFQFQKDDDGREHLFIHDPQHTEPVRLRLIEVMHELATQHSETLPMVQEIVAIGEQMSTLIHNKGGLVLSSNSALTESLGRYLAHYSILREVVQKSNDPKQLEEIEYNVRYPTELDGLLKDDIVYLQSSIDAWSSFSAELWNEAMPDTLMPVLTQKT